MVLGEPNWVRSNWPRSRPRFQRLLYSANGRSPEERLMLQTIALLLLLAPATEDKKPAFVGVQIAQNDDKVIIVMAVFNDSPAEKAGIKVGDVLVKINDVK